MTAKMGRVMHTLPILQRRFVALTGGQVCNVTALCYNARGFPIVVGLVK
jgi:hypothetical protein